MGGATNLDPSVDGMAIYLRDVEGVAHHRGKREVFAEAVARDEARREALVAADLGKQNIRVNAISAGPIRTLASTVEATAFSPAPPDDATGEHFEGGVVHGAHDQACQRDTTGASCVVGVHFKPGGAAAFFGGALPALRGGSYELDQPWLCTALDFS